MVITPLGQRQIFQAANAEAVRAAHQVSEQLQRENIRRKAADDKLAEDQDNVQEVQGSEPIRTEERKSRQGEGQEQGEEGKEGQEGEEEQEGQGSTDAPKLEGKLNFLA